MSQNTEVALIALILFFIIAGVGIFWLSRIPVHGSFLTDLLPGMLVMALGLGMVFVAVVSAANAGVPAQQAGLAAALLNAFQQVGGALGLAVFSAIGTAHTNHLLHHGAPVPDAMTSGFRRALLAASIAMLAAALLGFRTKNAHSDVEFVDVEPDARVEVAA